MSPELIGQAVGDRKDPNGKYLFLEFVKVCQKDGEGMVDYLWPKPGESKPIPKVSYVKLFKPWGWVAGTGLYLDRLEGELADLRILIGAMAAGIVLCSLAFSMLLRHSIKRRVDTAVVLAKAMAKGDFTQSIAAGQQDEVGTLIRALGQLANALRVSLMEVTNSAGTLAATSTGVLGISKRLASGANTTSEKAHSVAAAAEEASANTVSVATSMEHATTNLTSVASATEEMSATIGEISSNTEKARSISEQATAQAQTISSRMQQLGVAAKEIGKVTETITNISAQTNLLALNATIEAARAGAAGKGFAVVANEIKDLAQQTATATEDIKGKIAEVQNSTGAAITDIQKIAEVIKEVGGIVTTIAAAIEEQATVTKDVAGNIAQASEGVKEANLRVSETATVSKSIAQDIAKLSAEGRSMNRDSVHLEASGSFRQPYRAALNRGFPLPNRGSNQGFGRY